MCICYLLCYLHTPPKYTPIKFDLPESAWNSVDCKKSGTPGTRDTFLKIHIFSEIDASEWVCKICKGEHAPLFRLTDSCSMLFCNLFSLVFTILKNPSRAKPFSAITCLKSDIFYVLLCFLNWEPETPERPYTWHSLHDYMALQLRKAKLYAAWHREITDARKSHVIFWRVRH